MPLDLSLDPGWPSRPHLLVQHPPRALGAGKSRDPHGTPSLMALTLQTDHQTPRGSWKETRALRGDGAGKGHGRQEGGCCNGGASCEQPEEVMGQHLGPEMGPAWWEQSAEQSTGRGKSCTQRSERSPCRALACL